MVNRQENHRRPESTQESSIGEGREKSKSFSLPDHAIVSKKVDYPKVFIQSFGCQMNVYDAMRMSDSLAPLGYRESASPEQADLVILNTCHIREKASEKLFSELGKLRHLKEERAVQGAPLTIAVAGCVAQAEGKEIARRQSAVDLIVGPQNYHRLPDLLDRLGQARQKGGKAALIDIDFAVEDKFAYLPSPTTEKTRARGVSAFVTVQEGCDKFCTFCVVPYTRGAEISRPVAQILAEVENLISAGVKEIILLGQNVNAYHGQNVSGKSVSLPELIHLLAGYKEIARIRYMTSHPKDMHPDLIAAHGEIPALMPFLHLPVQSGSDKILSQMNRKHTAALYYEKVQALRSARPDLALSSDFIVGFPGETEKDFEETLHLMRQIEFSSSFFFSYSVRPGTPAALMKDQVPEKIKAERLHRLKLLADEQRQSFNRASVGQTLDILFEKKGRHPHQIRGKSPYFQPVHVEGPESLIGKVVPAEMIALEGNSLLGRLSAELLRDEEVPTKEWAA